MSAAKEKKDLTRRTAERLAAPDTLDIACADTANGGSLIDLAKTWDIRYSDLIAWIYIDEERRKRYEAALAARAEWSVERVLGELKTLGLADIRKAFDDEGNLKPIGEMPEEVARTIAGFEVFEVHDGRGAHRELVGLTKKVKFIDKTRSLELLGKNLKMFIERHEHTGAGGGPINVITGVPPAAPAAPNANG